MALLASLAAAQNAVTTPPPTRSFEENLAEECESAMNATAVCRGNTACAQCLSLLVPYAVNSSALSPLLDAADIRFFRYLSGSRVVQQSCEEALDSNVSGSALQGALQTPTILCAGSHFVFDYCQRLQVLCILNPQCQQCLSQVYDALDGTAADKLEAVASPQCGFFMNDTIDFDAAVNPTDIRGFTAKALLQLMAFTCLSLPRCTIFKEQCTRDPRCNQCLSFLTARNATALQACFPRLGASASELASFARLGILLVDCTFGSDIGCYFATQFCEHVPGCEECKGEMTGQGSNAAFATGALSSACGDVVSALSQPSATGISRLFASNFSLGLALFSAIEMCPAAQVSICDKVRFECMLYYSEVCIECLADDQYSPLATSGLRADVCELVLRMNNSRGSAVNLECLGCPATVRRVNLIVVLTAAVGGISVLGCALVMVVIVGYKKDLLTSRDRVLLGLLVSNVIYSSANVIPLNYLRVGADCGKLLLSFPAIRFGRAWWFLGKYSIVLFELSIVALSARALRRGVRKARGWVEALYYTLSTAGGLAAFATFYALCYQINSHGYNEQAEEQSYDPSFNHIYEPAADDDIFVYARDRDDAFHKAKNNYDTLVQRMLVAWLLFAAMTLLLWLYVHWLHHGLLRSVDESKEMLAGWDRDRVAAAQAPDMLRRRRLIELKKEGFIEVARPLQGYVTIFVAFAIPATVMATPWCRERSGLSNAKQAQNDLPTEGVYQEGMCDIYCEFVLAFRSIVFVLYYFSLKEHRRELLHIRTLGRRLRRRLMALSVAACPWLCRSGGGLRRTVSFGSGDTIAMLSMQSASAVETDDSYATAL